MRPDRLLLQDMLEAIDEVIAGAPPIKMRHITGDVAVFVPISGTFVDRFKEKAHRLFVADVSGDWREERIIFSGNALRICHNPVPSPNPEHPSLWSNQAYQHGKMTWNYYSP